MAGNIANEVVVDLPAAGARCPPVEATSWCYTQVEGHKKFTYAWTIEDFVRVIENYPAEQTLYSEQFTIPLKDRNTIWRLKVYPNGRKREDEGFVTLFLKDSGKELPANVKATVEFSTINNLGDKVAKKLISKEYKILHHAFGFSKYLSHAEINNPAKGLLQDGKLTIHCEITIKGIEITTITNPPQASQVIKEKQMNPSNLFTEHMRNMLNHASDYGADMKIKCKDGSVNCHSSILGARSPVFKAMFSHPMAEHRTRTVDLEDLDCYTCKNMLHFIYTGNIPRREISQSLLFLADKYDLPDLKDMCARKLGDEINMSNCIEYLIMADMHNCVDLKEKAKEYVIDNSTHLPGVKDWKVMLAPYPTLLAELLEGVISSPPQKRRKVDTLATRRAYGLPRSSLGNSGSNGQS